MNSINIDDDGVPTKAGLGNNQNRMDPASDVVATSPIEGSSIGSNMIPMKAPNKLMVLGIVLFGFFSMLLATILKFFVFAPVKKRKDEEEEKKNA